MGKLLYKGREAEAKGETAETVQKISPDKNHINRENKTYTRVLKTEKKREMIVSITIVHIA